MSDHLFIRDLRLRGIIGILPRERQTPQEIIVNVLMVVDTRPAAASDAIEDAVNYAAVAGAMGDRILVMHEGKVKGEITDVAGAMGEHVRTHRPRLVETLAADLAALVLETQPRVQRVRIRVEKPEALDEAAGVGVEIEREREPNPSAASPSSD